VRRLKGTSADAPSGWSTLYTVNAPGLPAITVPATSSMVMSGRSHSGWGAPSVSLVARGSRQCAPPHGGSFWLDANRDRMTACTGFQALPIFSGCTIVPWLRRLVNWPGCATVVSKSTVQSGLKCRARPATSADAEPAVRVT
jgi:hypothetical protein